MGSSLAAWYDPSDFSTMWQDSAGTTPVTALGQPVGLVLDKSRGGLGAALGAEVFPSYDFTAWSTAGAVSGRTANSFTTTLDGGVINPSGTPLAGRTYRVIVTGTTTAPGVEIRNPNDLNGSVTSGTGAFTVTAILSWRNSNQIYLRNTDAGTTTITSISFRELPGVHLIQPTNTSRPTVQARVNLLTRTEEFDHAAWTLAGSASRSANAGAAPDGTTTADRLQFTASASDGIEQRFATTVGGGVTYTASVWMRSNNGSTQTVRLKNTHSAVVDNIANCTVTTEWQRFSFAVTNGGSAGDGQILGIQGPSTPAAADILVWGAQLELGPTTTTYQRVTTATDYADVGAPRSLQFDGIDDSLYSASGLDLTTTNQLTVIAGIRKLSNTTSLLLETSGDSASINGTFGITVSATGVGDEVWSSRGTSRAILFATSASAPVSCVYSAIADIAMPVATIRRNGAQVGTTSNSQGTGNYSNAVLHVARRDNSSFPFNGHLFNLIIRAALTDDATLAAAERFVAQRTGVSW